MKLKEIFITLGLSLAVGMGVSAGLSLVNEKPANEVGASTFAANTEIFLTKTSGISNNFYNYGVIAIWNHGTGSGGVFDQFNYDSESGYYKATLSQATETFNLFRGEKLDWNNKWDQSDDSTFEDGKNLLTVNSWSGGKIGFTKGTYYSSVTITKTAVEFIGAEKNQTWAMGSDVVPSNETYDPDPVYVAYETWGGWFTDEDCTKPYDPAVQTSNTNIYAKYTQTAGVSGTAKVDFRDSGWANAAANYAIYYWNSTTRLTGWSNYVSAAANQFLVEINYEVGFTPTHLKVVRYSAETTEENWESDKWGESEATVWSQTENLDEYSDVIIIGSYDNEWNANYVSAGVATVLGGQSGDAQWSELASLNTISTNNSNHTVYSSSAVALTAGQDFKIVHGNNEWYGYYSCPDYMTNRDYFSGGNGSDIHVEKSGTYIFNYDSYAHSVYITSAAAEEAYNWAKAFLGVDDENNVCTFSMTNWTTMGTSFAGSGMSDEARAIIAGEEHIEHDADAIDYIAAAVQRYDYVLERYGVYDANTNPNGFVDFAGRVEAGSLTLYPSANVGALVSKELANNAPAIIAIVSAAAIASTGMYFFLRKRKEN